MLDSAHYLTEMMGSMDMLDLVLSGVLNLIFASGVAKDIHVLQEKSREPYLVPGFAWVLATATTGIMVAAIYWALHHSSLGK
jgi:hypothetical protein